MHALLGLPSCGLRQPFWLLTTFNGLVVTAMKLHKEGRAKRVGILDCDQHYGNGTEELDPISQPFTVLRPCDGWKTLPAQRREASCRACRLS